MNIAPYTEVHRPLYHFSPVEGWIGDPDGMIRYQGRYHVFWWGHAESHDLVHWQQRPYPMLGGDGLVDDYWSGSVVVDKENSGGFRTGEQPPMVAIYTIYNTSADRQTQGLSISQDYTSFHFYPQNPVLDTGALTARDPLVFWYEPTTRWIMVIALPEARKVRLYASRNLHTWEHLSDFGPAGVHEQPWEVPDLFPLAVDGDPQHVKWVMLVSVSPNRVQYFVGNFDGQQFTLDTSMTGSEGGADVRWLDFGPDYYAVRTYRDYDGDDPRTVTMGWMGNWEYAQVVPTLWGKGTLALPRELALRSDGHDLRLVQLPLPAFEQLRANKVRLAAFVLSGLRPLTEFVPQRNTYELDITFTLTSTLR